MYSRLTSLPARTFTTAPRVFWCKPYCRALALGVDILQQRRNMSSPVAQIKSIDHIVLTVKDVSATQNFYTGLLGMKAETFSSAADPSTKRHALSFGQQKINLHQLGAEFEPKAKSVCPGSADLCFVTETKVDEVLKGLKQQGIEVLEGGVVERTGAVGKLLSVYFRDPDGNLIEVRSSFARRTIQA